MRAAYTAVAFVKSSRYTDAVTTSNPAAGLSQPNELFQRRMADILNTQTPTWWIGLRLLKQKTTALLIASNTISSVGNSMQLLLLGWLALSNSALALGIFAVVRLVPKLLLSLPAGYVCDRLPRSRIVAVTRVGYAFASLLPLCCIVLGTPLAWLFASAALAGTIHPFDLSASRSIIGDTIDREDLQPAVGLNRAGSHIASMVGPTLAFVLISGVVSAAALCVSAAMLALGGLAILPIPSVVHVASNVRMGSASRALFQYLWDTPTAVILVLAGVVPAFVDKAVLMLLPRATSSGEGTVSMALLAPELGALCGALVLAMAPIKLNALHLIGAAMLYALFLGVASAHSNEAPSLLAALGFAGMSSAALGTAVHARLQGEVPAEMRGRVFAL